MLRRFNTNRFRLFLKGLVTAWVPVGIAVGWISWEPIVAASVMGASTFSIDGLFYVFGVGDSLPVPPKN